MSSENTNNRKLQELSGSNYEIADGQPDIRGWDVKDGSGTKIGKVKELLFDESARKVRYIITKLKVEDDSLDGHKVLVPIGIARLHENDDDVILPGVTAAQLASLPEYEKDSLTAEGENTIRNVFAGVSGAALAGTALSGANENFYDHDHFNEDNLYSGRPSNNTSETIPVIEEELQVGKREVETGGVRLRSRIVETPIQENINLREEKVHIERTPVDRPASASDIKEDYIELSETAEVPVVSKEARVVEEVSLNKEVDERTETISDTVRKTEVDVENLDTTTNRENKNF